MFWISTTRCCQISVGAHRETEGYKHRCRYSLLCFFRSKIGFKFPYIVLVLLLQICSPICRKICGKKWPHYIWCPRIDLGLRGCGWLEIIRYWVVQCNYDMTKASAGKNVQRGYAIAFMQIFGSLFATAQNYHHLHHRHIAILWLSNDIQLCVIECQKHTKVKFLRTNYRKVRI